MPAHSMASATISFGLVSIPVKLYSTGQSSESISFRMLHKKCGTPLKQQYICPKDNVTVERDDVAKGYEFSKDQYVLFSPDEIKAVEEEPTKAIAITEFVPIDLVDPIYFDRPYYLGPDKGAERAYRLLGEAMKRTGVVGLAQYAVRGKQYLVMLRPMANGLMMQQLRYASEVRPFSEIGVPDQGEVKPEELKLALQLMEQTMSKEFHPENYHDTVRDRMLEAIQKKVEGEEITVSPEAPPQAQIIDLMEALKASLGGAPAKPAGKTAPATGDRKPAKRSPRAATASESAERPARKKASK